MTEIIRAFYSGASVAQIATRGAITVAEVEMLLRGYIIGLREVGVHSEAEPES
jgi:hypothetical protein